MEMKLVRRVFIFIEYGATIILPIMFAGVFAMSMLWRGETVRSMIINNWLAIRILRERYGGENIESCNTQSLGPLLEEATMVDNVRLYVAAIWPCRDKGDWQDMLAEQLRRTLHQDNNDSIAILRYAQLLVEQQRLDESSKYWKLLHGAERVANRVFYKADALACNGEIDQAVYQYKLAAAISPDSIGEASYYRAGILIMWQPGRMDEAEQLLKKALEVGEPKSYIYNALAQIYLFRKDLTAAEGALASSLSLDPDNVQAMYLLGVLRRLQGHLKEAVHLLEVADAQNRSDPWVSWELGQVHWQLGNKWKARKAWCKALRIDSHFQPAQNSLERSGYRCEVDSVLSH